LVLQLLPVNAAFAAACVLGDPVGGKPGHPYAVRPTSNEGISLFVGQNGSHTKFVHRLALNLRFLG